MALDIDQLLQPIGAAAPSGEDLRHDAQFFALRQDIEPKFDYELLNGKEVRKERARDWQHIQSVARHLSAQSRDLRIQVILVRASLATDGVSAIHPGLRLIRQSLASYWDDIHPQLDTTERDPVDQAADRLNALRQLSAPEGLIIDLRRAIIVGARGLGGLSLRDIELAAGNLQPGPFDKAPEASLVGAVFKMAEGDVVSGVRHAIDGALDEVGQIEAVIGEALGDATRVPEFEPLAQCLRHIAQEIDNHAGTVNGSAGAAAMQSQPPSDVSPAQSVGVAPSPQIPPSRSARVDSREEVIACLDEILDYYRRREPSSPIPMVVERVKRLVPLSFMELMEDLAPSSVKELKSVAGTDKKG